MLQVEGKRADSGDIGPDALPALQSLALGVSAGLANALEYERLVEASQLAMHELTLL